MNIDVRHHQGSETSCLTHGDVARLYGVPVKVIEGIVADGTNDHSSATEQRE
jgi:hypothetical protein